MVGHIVFLNYSIPIVWIYAAEIGYLIRQIGKFEKLIYRSLCQSIHLKYPQIRVAQIPKLFSFGRIESETVSPHPELPSLQVLELLAIEKYN